MGDKRLPSSPVDLTDLEDSLADILAKVPNPPDSDIDSTFNAQNLEALELLRDRYRKDTEARNNLARVAMHLIIGWLIFVGWALICCGCGDIKLSDVVVCTLLATTTVNILGLAHTVLEGYFKHMSQDINLLWKKDGQGTKTGTKAG